MRTGRWPPSLGRVDFIEVYPGALDPAVCDVIVEHFDASDDLQDGRVGGGVIKDLKHSRDLTISGRDAWIEVERALNTAALRSFLQYVRTYPHTLLAPLMLQLPDGDGRLRRLTPEGLAELDDQTLAQVVQDVMRPGRINLQRYTADVGGYPYWHCELFPQDATAETLHRHVLWTVYLNDGFGDGETEFLYQQRKVAPTKGALLIAPAAYTHTHRGNRPSGGDKYIATSWLLFQRAA